MIEPMKDLPDNVLGFVCHGEVTREDYEAVLIPAVEKVLADHDTVRLYYETAADFEGIEAAAVWEDMKVGMSHLRRWERFAVVTDVEWIRHAIGLFSFLMPGELRVFPSTEVAQAREWIVA